MACARLYRPTVLREGVLREGGEPGPATRCLHVPFAQVPTRELVASELKARDPVLKRWLTDGLPGPSGQVIELAAQRLPVGAAGESIILVFPADIDATIEIYLQTGQTHLDPYWSRPWPSAVALASVLLQRRELVQGKVVCDLGAGLGLAGIAAAMAGASRVVLCDREPLALACALLSARATGLDAASPDDMSGGDVAGDQGQRTVTAALLDWNLPYRGRRFDVCLACDVLYEKFSVEPVATLVPQLVGLQDNASLILADPPTRTPENRGRFVELMAGSGMVLEESGTESARIDAMALADSDDADLFDMVGKVADSQISMMVFRNVPFGSTIGLKTLH